MKKYQTFTPRLFALIIDVLIFLPLNLLDSFFMKEASSLPVLLSLWLLVFNMAYPVYVILMHGFFGQTLGKMALKVKVVDTFEKPITFHHSILRELPSLAFNFSLMFFAMSQSFNPVENSGFASSAGYNTIIILVLVWSIADIAVFLFNDKRRSLHDFIAGTIVIRTNV